MSVSAGRTHTVSLIVCLLVALPATALIYFFWPTLTTFADLRANGNRSIPSESMAPTLLPGDYVMTLRVAPAELSRGMVIVFKLKKEDRVARIAGLPGDTVELREGVVFLNGQQIPQRPIGNGPPLGDGLPSKSLSERFPGEVRSHRILDRGENWGDDFAPLAVPPGALFVLGDNRDNAADSRVPLEQQGAGLVKVEQIVGRIESVYWAKDRSRIGRPIDPAPPGGKRKNA